MISMLITLWGVFASQLVDILIPFVAVWGAACLFRLLYFIIGGFNSYD